MTKAALVLLLVLAFAACGPHVKRPHAGTFEDFSVWVDDNSASAVSIQVDAKPYGTSVSGLVQSGARLVVPIGYLPSDLTVTVYFPSQGVIVRRNYVLGADYQLNSTAFWVIVK